MTTPPPMTSGHGSPVPPAGTIMDDSGGVPATPAFDGPCGSGRTEVERATREMHALSATHARASAELHQAQRQRMEALATLERDGRLADRRWLGEAKVRAHEAYRRAARRAETDDDMRRVVAEWLREIDRLNREARRAARRGAEVRARAAELDTRVRTLQLAADGARVAAEAARDRCQDARRALAACEEAQELAFHGGSAPAPSTSAHEDTVSALASPSAVTARSASAPDTPASRRAAILRLLGQDRVAFRHVATRLAEETGLHEGDLQLLLAELREAVVAAALDAGAFELPSEHPFWGQFEKADARLVAAALARLGHRFDGSGGWQEGRVPGQRELGMAVAQAGIDFRRLRYVPGAHEIGRLWEGASVAAVGYLAATAPELELDDVVRLLGRRAEPLGELWNNWGRLRPVLFSATV